MVYHTPRNRHDESEAKYEVDTSIRMSRSHGWWFGHSGNKHARNLFKLKYVLHPMLSMPTLYYSKTCTHFVIL